MSKENLDNIKYLRNIYLKEYWKDYKYISTRSPRLTKEHFSREENGVHSKKLKLSPKEKTLSALILNAIWEGFRQWFTNGSLHGVKYIVHCKAPLRDRITWIFIMLVSVSICSGFIFRLLIKWSSSPFVNVMDSLHTPVWAVPFPSVLICPHTRLKASFVNVSEVQGLERFFSSLVCPSMNATLYRRLDKVEMKALRKFVLQGSPSCEEVIKGCNWHFMNEHKEKLTTNCCSKYFKPIYTSYGLCYGFNTLPWNGMTNITREWQEDFGYKGPPTSTISTWSLDHGYFKDISFTEESRPLRAIASGEHHGLTVDLYLNSSERQSGCDGENAGFNVYVGSPTDHFYISNVIRVQMERMTTIQILPTTHRTEQVLRPVPPNKRRCFFQDEVQLEYYSVHTHTNCKQDMFLSMIEKECGCVPYSLPQKDLDVPICTTRLDLECVVRSKAAVQEEQISLFSGDPSHCTGCDAETLPCYPSCNHIEYKYSRVFDYGLQRDGARERSAWPEGDVKDSEVTRINVHFDEDLFLGVHRHAQYDDFHVIGAIGGLLSLFMGFSIISIAELCYFVLYKPLELALTMSSLTSPRDVQ